ncbi:MAG: ParB/RepB/Spo0J family partition protein [Candidatus Auribacterota bacterium]|nr:ParB/RepB/Spo0J family partition protein [Candidatus Auribacterota bacterium]
MEKTVLGRGLDALIGEGGILPPARGDRIEKIDESRIKKNKYQPRSWFEEKAIAELARSIREKGVIQPIIIRVIEDGYELIAGERRLMAARQAGLEKIPSIIKEISDEKELLEIALIENIQREDLNPIEKARSYRRLIREFAETQEQVAERVGKDRSSVANLLRLLELPDQIKKMIEEGRLNFGQARALLSEKDESRQLKLAGLAADGGISVRRLEKMVGDRRKKGSSDSLSSGKDPHIVSTEDALREALKTKVTISPAREGKGKIEIEYYTGDELDRLCGLLVNCAMNAVEER